MSLLTKNVKKKISNSNITIEYLTNFKTHLGTKISIRKPDVDEYAYGLNSSKNIILNSEISLVLLKRTLNFLRVLERKNQQILFVGTENEYSKIIKYIGENANQPYVYSRWIKGVLTNWESISPSIKFFNLFDRKLSKSKKQKQKVYKNFHGLRFMKRLPAAIFLINLNTDSEIINEAKKLNIPIIAIVDTNQPINSVDYPLLGNSESLLSILFYSFLVFSIFNKKE